MKTDVKVYHGDHIGGCVTVINYENDGVVRRIMIDYGASLSEEDDDEKVDYPWDEKPVEAVFFTHYHGDHVGRFKEIPENIPLYMGKATRDVMKNIYEALSGTDGRDDEALRILKDDKRIRTFHENVPVTDIKDFTITPYTVDHSAYDAYMFLIETPDDKGKKVILHTGDFRGHGYRGKNGETILRVIDRYVHRNGRKVDILITEGTMMTRGNEKVLTEGELQQQAYEELKNYKYVFLICSSTNLDSLTSFYCAAEKTGKWMYTYNRYFEQQIKTLSQYAKEYTTLYDLKHINKIDFDKMLYSEHWDKGRTQESLMLEHGFLAVIKPADYCQKFIDRFKGLEKETALIYSMWNGYIDETEEAYKPEWDRFIKKQEEKGIKIIELHTSGHATRELITKVIKAVDPQEAIMPIHTENRKGFMELEISEELKDKIVFT